MAVLGRCESATGKKAVVAAVAVGSNIHPNRNVPQAIALPQQDVRVTAVSTLYRTPALDRPHQAPFVNGVWCTETGLDPSTLKYNVLRSIETRLGRVREADAHADRPIDLDLVVYGSVVLREPGLTLPDPDILRRPFPAVPLLELMPDLVLPGTESRLADLPVASMRDDIEPLPELTEHLRRMLEI